MAKDDPRREKVWSKTIPDGPWDYVVVGSGMGGMTTAALLSKLGKRVLVLEQHYVAGGFTHVFKRPGFHWDVGVHAVGEVTEHSLTGRLLRSLTDGELEWASLGPVYDEFHFPDGFHIDFPDSPARFRQNLLDAFPDEREAIDGYLHLARSVAKSMKTYYLARMAPSAVGRFTDELFGRKAQRYLTMRTKDVVAELTDDPRLAALFTAQWGYYGSTPSRSSFAIQALVVKHFAHGGYYPVGGASRIAETLLGTVAKAGGWTAIRADVKRILVEDGAAVGVELGDGRRIESGRVVSAAGVASTVRRLLPPPWCDEAWARSVEALPPAPAHVCLYLGFEGDIRKAGASGANKWFYETWDMEADAWDVSPDAETLGPAPVLYCSFPSLKDPAHDPGERERHTGEIVTFVPYEVFEPWKDARWKKRGEAYEAFKERMKDRLLRQFFEHVPELEPMLVFAELSTPVSTEHFVRPVQGSIYGIEPTPNRFANRWLRPRAPIRNLFFSGSEVATVGVIGAMMGGVLAAVSAEPVEAVRYLAPLMRR
ncbi:MAG TPA: NAD(P)/FAD-dependent oxidoreductase [Sandaracinaceae bacterium LLY-WYZ-13_1]|nr:NAD(P)/FAD-dependent oxidoreductase [Sandaracinaceae bacterium LLY-WYZ-13_1]